MIAFNVGKPEQSVVLADEKTYVSDDLHGSDFNAEFASALSHSGRDTDSDKSGNSLDSENSNVAEQNLAINLQASKIAAVENNHQANQAQKSEAANTQNIEIGRILANEKKAEKSLQELNSEQKQSNSEIKSDKNVSDIISQIIPNKNQNQLIQPTSKLFTNNVVEIPQLNDNVQLIISMLPKTEQSSQVQESLEHLTLLSKGIFGNNLDFTLQSDDNSPKDQQSNEKSPLTKENSFINQVKSENHKADSELKLNENIDTTVKLSKQSDNTETSELYNKNSPFVQKSNNILVKNQSLTDSETPTQEFARVKLSDIPRRIMQLATTQASDGNSSAKLVMHPKSLGTIVVQLEIVKNVVKLHLTGEKREALSAVESSIGMLKERLQSKGLELDNVEYNLNDSNEQANSGKHNQTEKDQKQVKHTYNNENLSESNDENDKLHDNKILRHDNGTIIEKYI
jgi:flagellar hook-length control protein FliK